MSESEHQPSGENPHGSSEGELCAAGVLCKLGSLSSKQHKFTLSQAHHGGEPVPRAPKIVVESEETDPINETNPLSVGTTILSTDIDNKEPAGYTVKTITPHETWFDYSEVDAPAGLERTPDEDYQLWVGTFESLTTAIDTLVTAAETLTDVVKQD